MSRLIDKCTEAGISLAEFSALLYYSSYPDDNVDNILLEKGLLIKDNFGALRPSQVGNSLIEELIIGGNDTTIWEDQDLIKSMQDMFPSGRKNDTAYYYKGSKAEISRKLKTFISKYPNVTKEQIIKATADYVDSFHGDYKYMQLLKYFIEKDGESQLISFIENAGQHNEDSCSGRSVIL